MRHHVIAFLCVIGCGDDTTSVFRDAAVDTVSVDAPIDAVAGCPSRPQGAVGGPCTQDSQCDTSAGADDGVCGVGNNGGPTIWPASGYCITKFGTCTDAASCGAGNQCATVEGMTSTLKLCLPTCGASPCACPDDQVCAGFFVHLQLSTGMTACVPGTAGAIDGVACSDIGDCVPGSRCVADALESPGGQCRRVGCTTGVDSTCAPGGDGHCIDYFAVNNGVGTDVVCVDSCVNDSDCRQGDGYICFDAGGAVGKYCRHPQIGDGCATDTNCGEPAVWDCLTGAGFPGGLCTAAATCPTAGSSEGCSAGSSACYDPTVGANYCVDRCSGPVDTQAGCRAGYTCRDVDPSGITVLGCIGG